MVSLAVKALLVQAFLVFHVQAVLSAADKADAETVLKEMLIKEQGEICGSNDINNLLASTAKSNNRLAMWSKIEAISKNALEELDRLMKETLEKIAATKKRLEAKKLEEMDELGAEDITPFIKAALFDGGFDRKDSEQALASARLSQCGKISPRRCKRMDKKCLPDKDADLATIEAFKKKLSEHVAAKKVRVQGEEILKACTQLLPTEEGTLSYCEEMCTKCAMFGAAASNDRHSQTAGKTAREIQDELEHLQELGEKYSVQNAKCKAGTEALKGFKMTLAPLEVAIDTTFDEWRKANRALDAAQNELEDLLDLMGEQEETVRELEEKVLGTGKALQDAVMKVTQVKMNEVMLKASWKNANEKLKEAKVLMDDGDSALRAAETIKEKLASVIESLVNTYDFFVHEPLRNLRLEPRRDEPDALNVFDEVSKVEAKAEKTFRESMGALNTHCEKEAKPAFEKVANLALAPLCEFGGLEGASQSVADMVATRKQEVKKELSDCKSWYRDFSIPVSAGTRTEELVEPALLKPVIEAFPDASFASEYMPKWRTGGPFLGAIAELRNILHALREESAQLKSKIKVLTDNLEKNSKLREEVMQDLEKAMKENQLAESEKKAAEQLLEDQREQEARQAANLNRMKALSDTAYKAYQGALGKFSEVFHAGTVSLVQGKQATSPWMKRLKRLRQLS